VPAPAVAEVLPRGEPQARTAVTLQAVRTLENGRPRLRLNLVGRIPGGLDLPTYFRTAADLCEEFGAFVFNHNESLLYEWVEEHEPALFDRIRRLVRQGRWHIMGGWHLQPDCNMPSGESFVRQILAGRTFFKDRFGASPETAVNLDPFGHSRGLVQILARSGYKHYLFCRPSREGAGLPAEEFVWKGYDGSEVVAHLARAHYNSEFGRARERVVEWMKTGAAEGASSLLLWGVGDRKSVV